jgi:adenosylmethionine-8-amino-7-oxononanoate aminotransferase
MTRYPDTSVFFRKLNWEYPRITHGEGVWLFDDAGKKYLDASSGAFASNVGHGVHEIGDAMAEQGKKLAYVSGMTLSSVAVEEFAAELSALAPGDLEKVYPLSSGSDAVEAALKLARQYWTELGKPQKQRIVALSPSYHGNTMLALSASAREHYKTLYKGWLVDVIRVPAYDIDALESAIEKDADTIAALILEPVGGSSTGALVPPKGYLAQAREICALNKVLFIADEILVGAGRTGTWSALEPDSVVPDLQVLGKGIAAGFAPVGAVLAPSRITDVIYNGSGYFNHAQTFSHHPVSCAAGTATLRYIKKHKLIDRCAKMGSMLHKKLEGLRAVPHVSAVRGRGLLAGVELTQENGTPFPRSLHFAETLTRVALDAGLVIWPNVGHMNGTDGDLVMIAPPFVVTEEEIDLIVSRLRDAIVHTTQALEAKT